MFALFNVACTVPWLYDTLIFQTGRIDFLCSVIRFDFGILLVSELFCGSLMPLSWDTFSLICPAGFSVCLCQARSSGEIFIRSEVPYLFVTEP